MIEINLMEEKKKFKAPTIAGMDLSLIPIKWVIIALIVNETPGWFLKDYFNADIVHAEQEVKELDQQLRVLRKDLRGNESVKQQLNAFNRQIEKLKERSKQVDKIIKQKTNPKHLLERLARSTPDDLWFDDLNINNEKDISISGGARDYKSIGNFITAANNSPFFGKSLTLGDSKTVEEKKLGKVTRVESFVIKGKILVFDPWMQR